MKVDLNPAALTGVMHAGGEVTCFGGDLFPFKAEVTVFTKSTNTSLMAELLLLATLWKRVPSGGSSLLAHLPTSMASAYR